MFSKRLPSRVLGLGVAVLAAALTALALATGATATPAHASPHATPRAAAPANPTQDAFYSYTGSLTGLAPGTVLRTRSVAFVESNLTVPVTTTQLLYVTTNELGGPTVDVATVIKPLAGTGATKLVSWQMAYDGLASNCDPSFAIQGGTPTESTNNEEQELFDPLLAAGDTIVSSDYEGEDNEFVAGREEGKGTLDGIRAAESFLKAPAATTKVVLQGYSGGAIASGWAAELAPTYAPSLDIIGTAFGGIVVDLAHNLTYVNGSQEWSGAIPAALVGISRSLHIDLSLYLSSEGQYIVDKVGGTCLQSDLGSYPGLTVQDMLKPQYQDITKVPVFTNAFNSLNMGQGGTPREPMFMGVGDSDGTGDGVMVVADDEALAHEFCGDGLPVQFTVYDKQDHGTAAVSYLPGAVMFIENRLNGVPPTSQCATIPAGNSLTPLPAAPATTSPTVSSRDYLHLQFRSARGTAVTVRLRAFRAAIKGVEVELLSPARKVLATAKLSSAARDKLYAMSLKAKHTLAAGRYTIAVIVAKRTVASTTFTVRGRQ